MTIGSVSGSLGFVNTRDARSLSSVAQQDLRERAVKAVREGLTQGEAARVFGVSRFAVHTWVHRYEEKGKAGLKGKRKGRPSVTQLDARQTAWMMRAIVGRCPDQLRLPFALWTREAVQLLLQREFGIRVSIWTVGRYLKRWGLTPQKPLRRAFEQDPQQVRQWLKSEYPGIRAAAKAAGAQIHWGDEMGLRSDHQTGRSYGLRGQTPVIPGTGQRFRCNVISTITNRGKLCFMVFGERLTAPVYLKFLKRLLRQVKRPIFLIVDRHPVHRARAVLKWIEGQKGKLRVFFLPAYSPQLNPDELLNQDVKSNSLGRRRPFDREEMIEDVRAYLWSTQRRPEVVRSYFEEEHVRYAAAA